GGVVLPERLVPDTRLRLDPGYVVGHPLERERAERVLGAVEAALSDAERPEAIVPVLRHGLRLDRRSFDTDEDRRLRRDPQGLERAEERHGVRVQLDRPPRGLRLRLPVPPHVVALADVREAAAEVDVLPPQPRRLARARAVPEEEVQVGVVRRMDPHPIGRAIAPRVERETVRAEPSEDRVALALVQRIGLGMLPALPLEPDKGISRYELVNAGLPEHGRKAAAEDVLHVLFREPLPRLRGHAVQKVPLEPADVSRLQRGEREGA